MALDGEAELARLHAMRLMVPSPSLRMVLRDSALMPVF
jgi:hypothetical protein